MKTFFRYIKDLYGFSKRKCISILLLMIVDGLTGGIGLLMLIPLLSITGIAGQHAFSIPFFHSIINQTGTYKPHIQLMLVLALYLILIVMQSVIRRIIAILDTEITQGFTKNLRVSLYNTILKSEWSFFVGEKRSDITNYFTNEITRIGSGTVYFLKIISEIIIAVCQLTVAFMMSIPLSFFVLGCGLILLWCMRTTFRDSKKLGNSLRLINQDFVCQIMEQLDGVKEAKCYSMEAVQMQSFEKTVEKTRQNLIDFTKMQSKTTLIYTISAAVVISLLFYLSVIILKIPPSTLLIIIYIFARLWPSFKTIQSNIQTVLGMIPSYSALQKLTDDLNAHSEKINTAQEPAELLPAVLIRFENVCFRYSEQNNFAVTNLNFEIPAKKITAFVGKSGAGKSTIINLLIGLLKPVSGRITAGGESIDNDMLMKWRRSIAYVPQDPFLFNSTIRENLLRYTPGVSDSEIKEVLLLSSALDFVENLPQGVDTVIGDHGVRLSGGERQRIVLARALLRRPRYLVLDEATSSLDNENEYRIQKAVEALSGKLTVIIIAHRLSTIRNADNIIVIDRGCITEQGTYTELMQKKGSFLSQSSDCMQ